MLRPVAALRALSANGSKRPLADFRWAGEVGFELAMGDALKLRQLPDLSSEDVEPPTISTGLWAGLLPANPHTIRAAIMTCRGSNDGEVLLVRVDQRKLVAERCKRGWAISLAREDRRRDCVAVRAKSAPSDPVIMGSVLHTFFRRWPGDHFADTEAEVAMRTFVEGDTTPPFLRWRALIWR